MRGIDEEGNVANNVETEQCVIVKDIVLQKILACLSITQISSFVQTRGSIPLFWTQAPNLHYKPHPTFSRPFQDSVCGLPRFL